MNFLPGSEQIRKVRRWFFFCLFFLAPPLLLLTYGIGQHWTFKHDRSIEKAVFRLERQLLDLRSRAVTKIYLESLLYKTFRQASYEFNWAMWLTDLHGKLDLNYYWIYPKLWHFVSPEQWGAWMKSLRRLGKWIPETPLWRRRLRIYLKSLKQRFPGVFSFSITDRSGRLVRELSDSVSNQGALRQFYHSHWEMLTNSVNYDRFFRAQNLKKVWKDVNSFVGQFASPLKLVHQGHDLIEVNPGDHRHFFFAQTSPLFGFFVHVNRTSDWTDLAAKDLIFRFRKSFSKMNVKIGIFRSGIHEQTLEAMARNNQTRQIDSNGILTMYPLEGGAFIWARLPVDFSDLGGLRLILSFIVTVFFAVTIVLAYQVMVLERFWDISLRWWLIFLFLYASGLPLSFILIAGRDFLERRRVYHRQEMYDDLSRILRIVDHDFLYFLHRLEKEIQKATESAQYPSKEEKRYLLQKLKRIAAKYPGGSIMIVDPKGKTVWGSAKNDPLEQNRRRFIGNIASALLGTLNRETGSLMGLLIIDVMDGFMSEGDLISDFTRTLGRFRLLSIGKNPGWALALPLLSPDGKADYCVFGVWSREHMEDDYAQEFFPRIQLREKNVFIHGAKKTDRFRTLTPWLRSKSKFQFIWEELHLTGGKVQREVEEGGRNFLCVGVPPRELSSNYILAIRSDERVQKQFQDGWKILLGFVGVCLAVTMFLGDQLARRFLAPIADLAEGVESIKSRNFGIHLRAVEEDEFGDLKRAFNGMIEGLADLDLARIVQENLFPRKAFEIPPFRIFGGSLPALQLGGDYFDLRQLQDGRILFLIGDVSGHGVPAALIMAMAKSIVVYLEKDLVEHSEEITPQAILQGIQDIVFLDNQLKKMMSCMVGVLDPISGKIELSNAGHNYPVIFRSDGTYDEITFEVSMPLARKRKKGLSSREFVLPPGDTLLLFTDGIVEATGLNGAVLGYETVFQGISPLIGSDPEMVYDKIMNWHSRVVKKGPQEDDITILLLTCMNQERISIKA